MIAAIVAATTCTDWIVGDVIPSLHTPITDMVSLDNCNFLCLFFFVIKSNRNLRSGY